MRRTWPLRHRLLAALLGLCAAGLTVFATASVLLLERSLLAKVDAQLAETATTFGRRPLPPPAARRDPSAQIPTQFRIAFYRPSGTLLRSLPAENDDGPAIPASVISALPPGPMTVPAAEGSGEWRVLVKSLPDGVRLTVSMSLEPTAATVQQILVIEAVTGSLVLALFGALAFAVVRLGLRPLTRMEQTAQAIADGDIDRRVGDTDPDTETGRLGSALNVMLERLATALRASERSERRLRHFVADASHELRTPLTSIRGFAELYQHGQGAQDPAAGRLLRRIEAEAGRMGVLVEDMLLLARLDQEPLLESGVVDLHVLAGDVVHAARARERGRPIRLAVSAEPVYVQGDEHRLHRVIANMVGNALQHTPADAEIAVTVGVRAVAGTPAPGVVHAGTGPAAQFPAALIEVRDQGPGIDAEHLPYVFDRFYRAGADRSRDSGGTGLGLAITAALVRAHGGRVEASSLPGHGAAFRVLLPLKRTQGD